MNIYDKNFAPSEAVIRYLDGDYVVVRPGSFVRCAVTGKCIAVAPLSSYLVLAICAVIGATVGTRIGRSVRDWLERSVFERIPGYGVIRSLTQQMAGKGQESTWRPALVEIEDALVPGFIIEEFEDGRYTVFVPSIPTPFAGAVYVLPRDRVHPVDVPFTDAVRVVSRWGSGAKELVAAMERGQR